jgi:hypothetical protein
MCTACWVNDTSRTSFAQATGSGTKVGETRTGVGGSSEWRIMEWNLGKDA